MVDKAKVYCPYCKEWTLSVRSYPIITKGKKYNPNQARMPEQPKWMCLICGTIHANGSHEIEKE
jgi:hypothetical protein